jgi:hypothetical protein
LIPPLPVPVAVPVAEVVPLDSVMLGTVIVPLGSDSEKLPLGRLSVGIDKLPEGPVMLGRVMLPPEGMLMLGREMDPPDGRLMLGSEIEPPEGRLMLGSEMDPPDGMLMLILGKEALGRVMLGRFPVGMLMLMLGREALGRVMLGTVPLGMLILGNEALGILILGNDALGIESGVGIVTTGTVGGAREIGEFEGGERLRTRELERLMGMGTVVEKACGVGMLMLMLEKEREGKLGDGKAGRWISGGRE